MDNVWFQIIFGAAAIYFVALTFQIASTFFRLLAALLSGAVKWPGPRIHDSDRSASIVRERLGVGYENLFSAFFRDSASVMAGFVYSLLTFISSTPLLSRYIVIKSAWTILILSLFAFVSARMAFRKALGNKLKVDEILANLASKEEPRTSDAQSAETEYAIEHPLIGRNILKADSKRALDLYYESVTCHQNGKEQRALVLYQEAMSIDPSLHKHAYEMLTGLVQNSSAIDAGAIYYWMGVHSEYLDHYGQAADWYEKAVHAFAQQGYRNRESRARCNLGNVKMRTHDPSGVEEFEKAVSINPRNGIAHLNIARLYYSISGEGDDRYERALDAFADAIMADPLTYGPLVVSSLKQLGYTWKEDLKKITQKVESKQR
jgi:tetratricopeptide (TPR) repeat protein